MDLAAYKAAFDAILVDPNHYILVMEKDGELIGCVQVSYLPNLTFKGSWRAQFEGVRISRSHRGAGLGPRHVAVKLFSSRPLLAGRRQLPSTNRLALKEHTLE